MALRERSQAPTALRAPSVNTAETPVGRAGSPGGRPLTGLGPRPAHAGRLRCPGRLRRGPGDSVDAAECRVRLTLRVTGQSDMSNHTNGSFMMIRSNLTEIFM